MFEYEKFNPALNIPHPRDHVTWCRGYTYAGVGSIRSNLWTQP